ncbi:hypothetical protein A4X13_0g9412 [Tilletia indica]|uniref:Uncharacterized protein n=1 Tax=Tilletia indica TaxID=43049 RepID=A0A8T8S9P3_9BASI|nr:hypothetical protein A4X13_0g9412 [Tilletia indica]
MHQYLGEIDESHPDYWIPEEGSPSSTSPVSSPSQPQAQTHSHLVCADLTCPACVSKTTTASPQPTALDKLPSLEARLSKVIPLLDRIEKVLPQTITRLEETLPSLQARIESLEAFQKRSSPQQQAPRSSYPSAKPRPSERSRNYSKRERRSASPDPRPTTRQRDYYQPADTYRPREDRDTSVEFVRIERRTLQERLRPTPEQQQRRRRNRQDDIEQVSNRLTQVDLDRVD